MKRRVGCVLVREGRVIATGYNGTPRGLVNCNEGGCGRCNSGGEGGVGLSTCLCIHAEENALLEAGRERVGGGATLYCDTCPCLTCSIKIVQMGVVEVVYGEGYSMDDKVSVVWSGVEGGGGVCADGWGVDGEGAGGRGGEVEAVFSGRLVAFYFCGLC